MTTVGVTGASGHLGGYLLPYLWERGHIVRKIARDIPADLDVDVVIHLAAPRDWRDDEQITAVYRFNEHLARYAETHGARVINTGSWWQYATGTQAAALAYSRLKCEQQAMFPTSLVPFSIYGTRARNSRGFVPQFIRSTREGVRLAGASREPRDFIHVRDVCDAYRAALAAPDGIYEVRTGRSFTPASLVAEFGGYEPDPYPEFPSCDPQYRFPTVPRWQSRIDVRDHIRQALEVAA